MGWVVEVVCGVHLGVSGCGVHCGVHAGVVEVVAGGVHFTSGCGVHFSSGFAAGAGAESPPPSSCQVMDTA